MTYYEYEIDYNPKNGSCGVVAVAKKMTNRQLLRHLQVKSVVEHFKPRSFDRWEITKNDYDKEK